MRTYDLPEDYSLPDAMQFSPDGQYLAIQAFGRVDVLDTATGVMHPICSESTSKMGTAGVGFTADSGSVVYFDNQDHGVHVFDLERGQDRVLRASNKVSWDSGGDVRISTVQLDGRLVFVAINPDRRTSEIIALNPTTGKQVFSFARNREYMRELTVSPDGRWVAGCSTRDLRVWQIGGGKLPKRAKWHREDRNQYCFGYLALARDGAYLAAGGQVGGPVWAWDLTAGTELDLGGPHYGVNGVAFAPDRPLLAFTPHTKGVGQVVFWDAQARVERTRFDWGLGEIGAVAFSCDGFRCATASTTRVIIWDVDV